MRTQAGDVEEAGCAGEPRRRIAIVGNQAFSAINFRGPLIRELAAAGHTVYMLAPDYNQSTRAAVQALGATAVDYPLDRAGLNPLKDLRSLSALWRIFKCRRPDAVLCYFAKPVIYGLAAAALAGVPRRVALIEGAGYAFAPEAEGRLRRRILRHLVTGLYRRALRQAHRLFVLNRDDLDLFRGLDVLPPERLECLPGIGIDLDAYRPAAPVTGPVTFCLAARLIEEKGVRIYAEAARKVKAAHPEARFMLLGGLDESPGALGRAEVEAWVDEGLLEWHGQVEDVRPYLAASSVFVLPTHYREGLPRSILEAMAMSRPVITTDNPGCRDAVVDGECGYLVPVRDAERLAAAMCRFIERPGLIEEMGQAGRRRAEALYDVQAINRRLIAALAGARSVSEAMALDH